MKKSFTRLKDLKQSEQKTAIMMMSHGVSMDSGQRQEFLAELDRIEDKEVRKSGMQGLVAQWVMQDPEGACEFVESRDWEDGAGEEMRQDLASAWANLDPEATLDWRLRTCLNVNGKHQWCTPRRSWREWSPGGIGGRFRNLKRRPTTSGPPRSVQESDYNRMR